MGDAVSYEMFRRRGWLDYCLIMNRFDEEVALQFMTTLRNGIAMVKGLRIEFLEEVIAEVTRFPQEGKKWEKEFNLKIARTQFSIHQDPPLDIDKKQGTSRLSFPMDFIQLATFII